MARPRCSRTFAAVRPRRGGTLRSETIRTRAPAAAATRPEATSSGGCCSWPSWGGETQTRPSISVQGSLACMRQASPKPVSSSTVMPFQRRLIRKVAIATSLSAPLRIESKARRASSRLRLDASLALLPRRRMRCRRAIWRWRVGLDVASHLSATGQVEPGELRLPMLDSARTPHAGPSLTGFPSQFVALRAGAEQQARSGRGRRGLSRRPSPLAPRPHPRAQPRPLRPPPRRAR